MACSLKGRRSADIHAAATAAPPGTGPLRARQPFALGPAVLALGLAALALCGPAADPALAGQATILRAAAARASVARAPAGRALIIRARLGEDLIGRTSAARVPARANLSRGPSVAAALAGLLHGGAISEALYQRYYADYLAAKRSLGRLSGTRQTELGAVLANVQRIAATGAFTASRLAALFLTLQRNQQWWTTEPLLANGDRLFFPGSRLVWQYYAGQGIEIQWLGTFGEANGYFLNGHENANLRQVLSEALPLATNRAGGIAWEYLFRFDGGSPPWTSGLSQGTALQVLARAWSRFHEGAYLTAAQRALGVFETPPGAGVRVNTAAGALYAEYTYAPGDRILNGFIQALVGLYDYTSITKDPLGLALFQAGDAEARAEIPHYDTGAWSLYDQFGESTLSYHELLTEFLQHLCERTRNGPPISTTPTPPPATPGSPSSPAASIGSPIAGDQIYCTTAQRFTADLHTPPGVALLTRTLRGGTRGGVQVSLSKISSVSLTVRQGARVVWTNHATLERGRPRLLWVTPTAGGSYSVTIGATDLAGNSASTNGTITLTAPTKAH